MSSDCILIEDGIYLLLAAYVVSAIAGWNLGLRFKRVGFYKKSKIVNYSFLFNFVIDETLSSRVVVDVQYLHDRVANSFDDIFPIPSKYV